MVVSADRQHRAPSYRAYLFFRMETAAATLATSLSELAARGFHGRTGEHMDRDSFAARCVRRRAAHRAHDAALTFHGDRAAVAFAGRAGNPAAARSSATDIAASHCSVAAHADGAANRARVNTSHLLLAGDGSCHARVACARGIRVGAQIGSVARSGTRLLPDYLDFLLVSGDSAVAEPIALAAMGDAVVSAIWRYCEHSSFGVPRIFRSRAVSELRKFAKWLWNFSDWRSGGGGRSDVGGRLIRISRSRSSAHVAIAIR